MFKNGIDEGLPETGGATRLADNSPVAQPKASDP